MAQSDRFTTWRKRNPLLAGKPGNVCMVMLSTVSSLFFVGGQ